MHRREVEVIRAMVKAVKEKCWRDFCMKEGAQSLWGVVRWAKDPFGVKEHMDGLTGDEGSHVRDDVGIVRVLMRKVIGEDSFARVVDDCGASDKELKGWYGGALDLGDEVLDRDVVRGWVLGALKGTKNNSAPGSDGVGYRLIKAVRDT